MHNIKKFVLSLTVIYSLILVTACPSKSDLVRAFNRSAAIGGLAETAAVTTGDFYKQGFISLEWKDDVASQLDMIVKNGKSFHKLLVALKAKYAGSLANIPKWEIADLDPIFSRDVIEPFLAILVQSGALPPEIAKKVMLAFSLLRTAIMTISGIFGSGSVSYNFYLHQREVDANAAG